MAKKLYRSKKNRKIAGVCGGIGMQGAVSHWDFNYAVEFRYRS
jgi:phage shock protein PspC (stress-responsive transcriptional regulator)